MLATSSRALLPSSALPPKPRKTRSPSDLTRLLRRVGSDDAAARNELWQVVYQELHALAARAMHAQRTDHTLQATALVHEVWLRVERSGGDCRDREHFLATVSRAMRQILVDAARARQADKRTPPGRRAPLEDLVIEFEERSSIDVEALDRALAALAEADPEMARVVELRFFAGAEMEEVARIVGMSKRTLERRWAATRAWLGAQMG